MAHRTVVRPAAVAAPVRLDFAGGWTDVPPFSAREGGVVVNAAIGLLVRATVRAEGRGFRIVADDIGEELELPADASLAPDGRLDLHKAALRMLHVRPPVTLRTSADAPKGSGVGGSGALDVAMVAALDAATAPDGAPPLDAEALAEAAWRVEAIEAGVPGGRQDQWAAALGGCNLLRFRDPQVTVEPLALEAAFAAELARRTLLCYTGVSRLSGDTIARVMNAYERGEPGVTGALRALCDVAERMAVALRCADLATVAALLSENWRHQQSLDPRMSTPAMVRLEGALRGAGALGGKAAGSGAGGCMFFIAGDDVGAAEAAARSAGAQLLPVRWEFTGARPC
jgi:D-glycero-alpha-D-manno-heptose-7-phosphate kinase